MGLGFWEALIVLPILMLATAFGLTRLSRLVRQWKQADQRQSSLASLESQSHSQRQITDYKPHGWMDEELAHQKRDKVRIEEE
jgi:type II secretory pathway pseudopilin PulG